MLDEHFEDQMNEIIKLCPVNRQTMLFSATMTDQVCRSIVRCWLLDVNAGFTFTIVSWVNAHWCLNVILVCTCTCTLTQM